MRIFGPSCKLHLLRSDHVAEETTVATYLTSSYRSTQDQEKKIEHRVKLDQLTPKILSGVFIVAVLPVSEGGDACCIVAGWSLTKTNEDTNHTVDSVSPLCLTQGLERTGEVNSRNFSSLPQEAVNEV